MSGLIKKLSLCIFSTLVAVAVVYLDFVSGNFGETEKEPVYIVREKADDTVIVEDAQTIKLESGEISRVTIEVASALVRVAPESFAEFSFDDAHPLAPELFIHLKEGRLWINTINSMLHVKVKTPRIEAVLNPGIFDLHFDSDTLAIAAHRRHGVISFSGVEMPLPETRQMIISGSKIALAQDLLKKLHYSKLAKEFPFTAVEEPDSWVNLNQRDDELLRAEREKIAKEKIKTSNSGEKNEAVYGALQFLTLDEEKKQRRAARYFLSDFDAVLYELTLGDPTKGERMLKDLGSLEGSQEFSVESAFFKKSVAERLSLLAYTLPTDEAYRAYYTLLRETFTAPLDAISYQFNAVLDAYGERNATLDALERMAATVTKKLPELKNQSQEKELFFLMTLYHDFLAQHPEFIREEYLKTASALERAHLDLIKDQPARADDERQFLMGQKLARISALQKMMEKEDLPFAQARGAVLVLAQEVEALKPTFSSAAVISYFEKSLNDLQPLILFLRSARGIELQTNFTTAFEEYKSDADEIKQITELLNAADGGTQISPVRREELAGIVASDFKPLGIGKIKIALPDSEDDPRVRVLESFFDGEKMEAIYDTSRKIVTDINFKGERFPHPVRLTSLKEFLLVKLGKNQLSEKDLKEKFVDKESESSTLEKIAVAQLKEKLSDLGIEVEQEYLGAENFTEGIVHVRLASVGKDTEKIAFSFDIEYKGERVSSVKVQTVSGVITVNESFALRELPLKVEQIWKRAQFEKQKEDDIKDAIKQN